MAINFPNTPNPNDTHSSGGKTWIWDGTSWKYQGVIPTQGTGWTPGAKPPSPDMHGDVGPVVDLSAAY